MKITNVLLLAALATEAAAWGLGKTSEYPSGFSTSLLRAASLRLIPLPSYLYLKFPLTLN
jgi:hypothetical protein